jgi:hypothetical protein
LILAERFLVGGNILDDPYNRKPEPSPYNLTSATTPLEFKWFFGFLLNTWIVLGYCPGCIDADGVVADSIGVVNIADAGYYKNSTIHLSKPVEIYKVNLNWVGVILALSLALWVLAISSIFAEAMVIAPDTLGYVTTTARNSKFLHLPAYTSQMSSPERLWRIGGTKVMMQDVQADEPVGRIVLGNQYDGAAALRPNRNYR